MTSPQALATHLASADRVVPGDIANKMEAALREYAAQQNTWLEQIDELKADLHAAKGQRYQWQERMEDAESQLRQANRLLERYKALIERAGIDI
jgi:chromosome segregation ATPase